MAVYETFRSVTGQELEKALWPAEGVPKGVVQFVHGMAEHISRYDAAAQALPGRTDGTHSLRMYTPCGWKPGRLTPACPIFCLGIPWAASLCADIASSTKRG